MDGLTNIERIGALEAMKRARGNRLRRYPSPARDSERLFPLASPSVTPGFSMTREDTVYTIGSCFARNIEKVLAENGMRVLSREFDLGEIGASLSDPSNFFNKYTIHSILNELRWALERETFPGADVLYPVGPDRYVDAQLGMMRLDFDEATILAFRQRYLDALAMVREADVIVLTLGYVETWFDRKLGLYLNIAPPLEAMTAEPRRFEFRVLSYRDVIKALEDLHALLLRHRTKPLKMLVTVSPVPLLATFRNMDVLVANAYSKSVQRAALDEFVQGKDGVDYFPSYEFVTLSNPTVAWSGRDYRHVSPDIINRIMDNVLESYLRDDDVAVVDTGNSHGREAVVSSMRMLVKLERYDEVMHLATEHRAEIDAVPEALMIEATAARRLGNLEAAFGACEKVYAIAPRRADALERMIALCRPLKRQALARDLIAQHATAFPERTEFREKYSAA